MSGTTPSPSGHRNAKQKRLGPAPIASFDISFESSEEVRSKMESNSNNVPENRLANISEQDTADRRNSQSTTASNPSRIPNRVISMHTGNSVSKLGITSTPRIDISRASSSSQQEDSRDSSPENVFDQVGTGTLQETDTEAALGFQEDGTNELRSSTEELYFMEEKDKIRTEPHLPQARRSPIQLRFEEQQQVCLTQNQRKDSASSEVAALLCISGRTSRISSVGSQGSAVSRISAISGISRSPSPSKTQETVPMDVLDQAILARKQELQQDFRVELARNGRKDGRGVTNGDVADATGRRGVGAIGLVKKSTGALKSAPKPIVGVTREGTQYIRIKLKPDHMYEDNGLGANEHVVDDVSDALKRPPASLSLGQETPKKAAPHFSQLVQADENRLTPNLSPKPSRQVGGLRSSGSRSPSPATVTVSRKSSFCSLFKSKETILSPESPTAAGQRKKSAISVLLDSPRDRSRSKSRDSERSGPSQNGTPNKQKSILAIFKPKRSGSKSKSSSPIDHEVMAAMDTHVDIRFLNDQQTGSDSRPKSAQRLRYYDTPTDGKSIYIPLHTPPEEKDGVFFASDAAKPSVPSHSKAQPQSQSQPIQQPKAALPSPKENTSFHPKNIKPMMTNTTTTTTTTPASRSQTPKIYRFENPDGSIRIPLRSPSDERVDAEVENSNWSTTVQRNSSQESQETVVSSQAPSLTSTDNIVVRKGREKQRANAGETETIVTDSTVTPVATSATKTTAEVSITQPITASPLTKEKKRILFSTRIGSGSEEQIFATQLSLSKTESLSSQLSEQAILDSPPVEASNSPKAETQLSENSEQGSEAIPAVRMRQKDENAVKRQDSNSQALSKEELVKSNRHSMYIENIDEIMMKQKQIDSERKEAAAFQRERDSERKPERVSSRETDNSSHSVRESANLKRSGLSAEDRAGSSESERDSEADPSVSKLHMPRGVGAVEEESAGLVTQDSYDDELPYVPTTLPEERSIGVAIMPIKERALMDVRTCPVDRPRSTTPLNPSFLEDYCGSQPDEPEFLSARGEKLRISLPRKESRERGQKAKSPRRVSNASGKSWFEFAEQGIGGTGAVGSPSSSSGGIGIDRRCSNQDDEPPPIPPRKAQNATEWINFENIPEKRKAPKRITTLPQKDSQEMAGSQYNYVNPEDCQCECHEIEREGGTVSAEKKDPSSEDHSPDDTVPLLESDPDECIHRTE